MNKYILYSLLALTVALPAYADHHELFIQAIAKNSDTSCAVILEISGDDQDAFVAEDYIDVDGTELVNFSGFITEINASGGNNDTGDTILAASTSFAADEDIGADLSFDDNQCALLTSTSTVSFIISDPELTPTVDAVDISQVSGFDNATAIVKTSAADTPALVDLSEDSIDITNNDGDSATVGTVDSAGNDDGGCSLSHFTYRPTHSLYALLILAAPLLVLVARYEIKQKTA